MARPKKDPNAEATVKESYVETAARIKKTGALSPALAAALDEIAVQLTGLDEEYKKVHKQFKALTKI